MLISPLQDGKNKVSFVLAPSRNGSGFTILGRRTQKKVMTCTLLNWLISTLKLEKKEVKLDVLLDQLVLQSFRASTVKAAKQQQQSQWII